MLRLPRKRGVNLDAHPFCAAAVPPVEDLLIPLVNFRYCAVLRFFFLHLDQLLICSRGALFVRRRLNVNGYQRTLTMLTH